jgi:ribosomal protein S18 acetylase RimI-like enzyme
MSPVLVRDGLDEPDREAAAAIVWDAFREKLGVALGDKSRGCAFLAQTLDADMTVTACDGDTGALLGVLVLTRADHTGPGGEVGTLWRTYGVSSVWRLALLIAMESSPSKDAMHIDSICVVAGARGRGVGSALMEHAIKRADAAGKAAVELEVIDANPRARELYARLGYATVTHESVPWPLSRWLGIRGTTRMRLPVTAS